MVRAKQSSKPVSSTVRLKKSGRLKEFEARLAADKAADVGPTKAEQSPATDETPATAKAAESEQTTAAEELRDRVEGFKSISRQLPASREAASREIYLWAVEHLHADTAEIDPGTVPSRAAISILIQAISSPEAMEKFLARHMTLTSGRQSAADLKLRFEEDAEKLAEFCEKLERLYRETEEREAGPKKSQAKS